MKDEILRLRDEGKSYNEIQDLLGCSKGTISYHCGAGQKDKSRRRQRSRRKEFILVRKVDRFKARKTCHRSAKISKNPLKSLRTRSDDFQRRSGSETKSRNVVFKYEDVLRKFGKTPTCYLTGVNIDLMQPLSYAFDHIIPATRGGDNSLDNLGLTTRAANCAKSNMTAEELFRLCELILTHNGYKVERPHGR